MSDMSDSYILAYTDGACSGNGTKNATGGMGVHFACDNIEDISETYDIKKRNISPTNITTEFLAIYLCIQKAYRIGNIKDLYIVTDSINAVNTFLFWLPSWIKKGEEELKKKKNLDIIMMIRKLMDKCKPKFKILFLHIRGHGKEKREDRKKYIKGNKVADKLAVAAKFRCL